MKVTGYYLARNKTLIYIYWDVSTAYNNFVKYTFQDNKWHIVPDEADAAQAWKKFDPEISPELVTLVLMSRNAKLFNSLIKS